MTRSRSLSHLIAGAATALLGAAALATPAHADGLVGSVVGAAATGVDATLSSGAQAGQRVLDTTTTTLLAPAGSATDCTTAALGTPFAGLGDARQYVLAPGGDFETGGAGWTFGPGARVVAAAQHDGAAAGSVLSLGAGAVAVSPPTCVDLDYPTARLWSKGGGVSVLVSYLDGGRIDRTRLSGRVPASADWSASNDLDVRPETGGTTGGWRRATFTFVATGPGTQVDDFYIDPRMH